MRAAIYARVSTERQERQQSIDSQLAGLRRWAEAEGHELAEAHVFRDDGYSGSRLDRPGLDGLRDAVSDAAVEIVAVLSPDRLARRYAYQVLLLEEFRRAGVEVAFLHRPISEDPSDQLLLQIQGAVAEYERAVLAERFRRGKLQKARDGHLLSAKAPYGYRYVPQRDAVPGHLFIDDAEAEMVRGLYAWVADEHLSVRQGVRRLNEGPWVTRAGRTRWASSTVHHILSDPVYIGTAYANRYEYVAPRKPRARSPRCEEKTCRRPRPRDQWIAIPVPPLVDRETWDRAQAQLGRSALGSFRKNKKHDYLLRCLLKCGICGLAIHGCGLARTAGGVERLYYRCAGVDALTTGRDTKCPRAMIDAEVIERAVWDHVVGLLGDPRQLVAQFERFTAERRTGAPRSRRSGGSCRPGPTPRRGPTRRRPRPPQPGGATPTARADRRLLEAYQAEVISLEELAERRRAIAEQQQAAAQQRDQHRRLADQRVRVQAVLANVAAFGERIRSRLEEADFGERQAILQLVVERIVVHEDTLEIHHVIPLRDPGPADGSAGPATPRDAGLRSDGVRPAGGLEDRARRTLRVVEPVEAGVGVRLRDAGEAGQVALGVLALAVGGIEERDRRRVGPGERPVVPDVAPHVPGPGPPLRQHRDRGVVAVQPLGREHVRPDRQHQRRQAGGRGAHPVGEGADVDLDPFPGVGRALPGQRQVLAVLRRQHQGEQAGARPPAGDRVRGRRRLTDRLAGAAADLLAHVLDHLPAPRLALERLGDVLAELPDWAAALGAGARGGVDDALTR